jgi:hypothetical protein
VLISIQDAHGLFKPLCKFFDFEVHWGGAAFCGRFWLPGQQWAKAQAAFFLIRGYFIIHQVIFTPWGVTKCQKSFPK